MTFDEILGQVLQLLQRQGRVSYRALKRRFTLDDEYLEDLKAELIKGKHVAVDEDSEVWSGWVALAQYQGHARIEGYGEVGQQEGERSPPLERILWP